MEREDIWYMEEDGVPNFIPEYALVRLLQDEVLFCNFRPYSRVPWRDRTVLSEKDTVVLFAIVNDIFAWGVADAEPVETEDDLEELINQHLDDPKYGVVEWACRKRDMQPQAPVRDYMKAAGKWTEELDNLPLNEHDQRIAAMGG